VVPQISKLNLTHQAILNAKPMSSRFTLCDGRGLELRITPSGKRTWAFLFRLSGKKWRYTIGEFPAISLKDARKISDSLRGQIAVGQNPQKIRVDERVKDELTVGRVYQEFLKRHLQAKLRSWKDYDRAIRKDFISRYEQREIASVKKLDLLRVTDDVIARGATIHANRLQQYVKRFFNWCVEMDYISVTPFNSMPKPSPERSRDRVLSLDEVKLLYSAAGQLDHIHCCFLRLLILTGQRRSEIANLKWHEIHNDHLQIEANRSKNNHKIVTPLSKIAHDLISSLPQNNGEYVFSTTGGRRPIAGFSKMKNRIVAFVEFNDWRFHDLRRTIATALEEHEVDRFTIQCVLNHSDNSITAVYDRSSHVKRKRRALERWQHLLFETDNVLRVISR
jgi:integrase